MDKVEIMQRALGVLMLTYDHEAAEAGDDLRAALKVLQQGVFSYEVALGEPPAPGTEEVVKQALDQVLSQFAWFTAGFMFAFRGVVQAYENDCPDVDVKEVLRALAIQLAERNVE
ncbi:hypothetical protein FKR81_15250 [Lentzea tibetensis]|uniref:Uncharacterized protein n=1 Tax=Lentzea tibetensis TaxID=2591470 RepID=A0A563EV41_9PSEU|nr:hypothetical protein [Lentzea tibetensis]TWP51550.1 hypothetical protein FKR81_15250 [Lentzea tibetensis]